MIPDRILPHSLDAEKAVLGAVLVNPQALYDVAGQLRGEDFFRQAHRQIWAACVALSEQGIPPDVVTAKNELAKRGDLTDIGGPSYLAGLTDGVPRTVNAEYYARIVKEKALLRTLIAASSKLLASAYEASDDATDILGEAERALLLVSQDQAFGELLSAEQLLPETMAMLARIFETRRAVTGLPTGFADLDSYTRGWQPGNLIVLGGRPGEGKSALALQMALHAARTAPVAFFSMEMSREEVITRGLAQIAKVDHHTMMQGRLSEADQQKVGTAQHQLASLPIAFDDTSAQTPFQIRSKAKKLQARKGLGFVVVDYLQLLQRPKYAHSREEAVADNTWALKVLAGELKVPVLALSQLNRASAKEERRPTLADLRESGAVEQHANVVLLIYKPPTPEAVISAPPPVELLIAKQRNGPQGVHCELYFNGPSMRFEDVAR